MISAWTVLQEKSEHLQPEREDLMVWHCHLSSHQTPFLQQRKLTLETHSARRAFLVQLRGADMIVWCLVLVPGGDKAFPWVNYRHEWRKVHVLTIFLLLVITWQKRTQSKMDLIDKIDELHVFLSTCSPNLSFGVLKLLSPLPGWCFLSAWCS